MEREFQCDNMTLSGNAHQLLTPVKTSASASSSLVRDTLDREAICPVSFCSISTKKGGKRWFSVNDAMLVFKHNTRKRGGGEDFKNRNATRRFEMQRVNRGQATCGALLGCIFCSSCRTTLGKFADHTTSTGGWGWTLPRRPSALVRSL